MVDRRIILLLAVHQQNVADSYTSFHFYKQITSVGHCGERENYVSQKKALCSVCDLPKEKDIIFLILSNH